MKINKHISTRAWHSYTWVMTGFRKGWKLNMESVSGMSPQMPPWHWQVTIKEKETYVTRTGASVRSQSTVNWRKCCSVWSHSGKKWATKIYKKNIYTSSIAWWLWWLWWWWWWWWWSWWWWWWWWWWWSWWWWWWWWWRWWLALKVSW